MTAPPPLVPRKRSGWKVIGGLAAVGCCGCGGIGILAAVAFPEFVASECKARQIDAKEQLQTLRQAEERFRDENGFYTSDLGSLDWAPAGGQYYLYGFATPGPGDASLRERASLPGYDEARRDTSDPAALGGGFDDRHVPAGVALPADSVVSRDGFQAAAVGNVDVDDDLDRWTIDQTGSLRHTSQDCGFGD